MNASVPPSRLLLEQQSQAIEHWLSGQGSPAAIHGGRVLPRWIRFELDLPPDAPVPPGLADALAATLGLSGARLVRYGPSLALDLPRPDPQPVRLLRLMSTLPDLPAWTGFLGLAEDGSPLLVRLPAPEVQSILVAGEPGAGKTELLLSLTMSLAVRHRQSQLQVALAQARSGPLAPLAGLPHLLYPPASGGADGLALLFDLAEDIERRQRHRSEMPRIVVVVDDLNHLAARGGRRAEAMLAYLLQSGPACGLHLLAAVREPQDPRLGPLLAAGFGLRLCGRVSDQADAVAVLGRPDCSATDLLGAGDFLASAAGQLTGFQAAWIPPEDWADLQAMFA